MLRDLPPYDRHDAHVTSVNIPGVYADDHRHDSFTPINPLEDVFGSGPPSPSVNHHNVTNSPEEGLTTSQHHGHDLSDIPRLRSTHVTNGYREGIAASKEEHIQAGFDEGYSLGGEIGMKAGWCLGTLEGLSHLSLAAEEMQRIALQQDVSALLRHAQEELKMTNLLSPQHFGPDGIWLFEVPGQDEVENLQVTFADVAAAHPVIAKWRGICIARLESAQQQQPQPQQQLPDERS